MVDALHEIHRVLRPGGLLVDARPDSTRVSRIESGGRLVATVNTARVAYGDDRASDRAVERTKRDGLFRSRRRGMFWYRLEWPDAAALQDYLDESLRLVHRVRWRVTAAARRKARRAPITVARPVRYELLEKLPAR